MDLKNSLRQLLEDSFSREELKTLIFSLGLDYDEFPEHGRKSTIVQELVARCWETGRIKELVHQAQRLFPSQSWPDVAGITTTPPRQPFEPETVLVPAGEFIMGAASAENVLAIETPAHTVYLPTYRIGRYPITNAQYGEFVKRTGYQPPKAKGSGWMGRVPRRYLDHPVRGVSGEDAQAYCSWLTTQTGRSYRLPTEAEWEKAARSSDGRLYPWGNAWDKSRCHYDAPNTLAVTDLPSGESPYGCAHMLGNVWEWTSTAWGRDLEEPQYSYPYQPDDGREAGDSDMRYIIRGGGFTDSYRTMRCTMRDRDIIQSTDSSYGFRVVEAM